MKEFVGLREKTLTYLMDDDTEHKKVKRTKKCVIKREREVVQQIKLQQR